MQITIMEKRNQTNKLLDAFNNVRMAIEKNNTCANNEELEAFFKLNDRIHFMFKDQYLDSQNITHPY